MNHSSRKNCCPKKGHSLWSQLWLVLIPILVVALPLFLLTSVAKKWGGEVDDLFILFAFGGSFLGTLTFWILFECDFLRSKQMKKIVCAINNLKEDVNGLDTIVRESLKKSTATPGKES